MYCPEVVQAWRSVGLLWRWHKVTCSCTFAFFKKVGKVTPSFIKKTLKSDIYFFQKRMICGQLFFHKLLLPLFSLHQYIFCVPSRYAMTVKKMSTLNVNWSKRDPKCYEMQYESKVSLISHKDLTFYFTWQLSHFLSAEQFTWPI